MAGRPDTLRRHMRVHAGEMEGGSGFGCVPKVGEAPGIARVVVTPIGVAPVSSELPRQIPEEAETPGDVVVDQDVDVLSLSPTPMSPLRCVPHSPKTAPPIVRVGGKPRGMLEVMKRARAVSPSSSSSASMPSLEDIPEAPKPESHPPPPKKMRLATFTEHTTTSVILDGKVVKRQENHNVYVKKIEVDEDGEPLGF